MATYSSPGVYVEEMSGPRPIEGVSTSVAAFVGYTAKGTPNTPVFVTNFAEYQKHFGGFRSSEGPHYTPYAVKSFFEEGGSKAYVVRHLGTNGVAATCTASVSVATTDESTSTTTYKTGICDVIATSVGAWGNNISCVFSASAEGDADNFNFHIYDNGVEVERYDNITFDSSKPSEYIFDVVNENSNYIEIVAITTGTTEAPVGTVYSLLGGTEDQTETSPDFGATLANLDTITDFSMLITPDCKHDEDQAVAANYCNNRKDCFYIGSVDGEGKDNGLGTITSFLNDNSAEYYRGSFGFNSHAAIYTPYITVKNSNGRELAVPPAGAIAGIFARTDSERGVFKAPAGTVDGRVKSALGLNYTYSKGQQDQLNPIGINVIRNIPGAGNVIWGARTTAADAQWRYIPVRRLVTFIEKSIENSIQWAVFEPNTPKLWSQLTREIKGFLRGIWTEGGLFGESEDQAFFVKIDEENNPQSSRDAGKLIINVGVATVKPTEFVVIRIEQTQSDV